MKHLNTTSLPAIDVNKINNLDLRSVIENNNIYDTYLQPQGYVGNRQKGFTEEYHEDDTWAIDILTLDGMGVVSYLYSSEYEYEQDLKTLEL